MDEQVIIGSHELYSSRAQLHEHMNSEIEKGEKLPRKKYEKITDAEVLDEAYSFYTENLSRVNEELMPTPEGETDTSSQKSANSRNPDIMSRLEEESIKLED